MIASSTTTGPLHPPLRPRSALLARLLPGALACLSSSVAWAGEAPSVLVTEVEAPAAAAGEASRITEALRRAVARRSDVRAAPSRTLAELRFVLGCEASVAVEACLSRGRGTLGADRVVFGSVAGELRVRVLDGKSGQVLSPEVREPLPAAALEASALDDKAGGWLASLLGPAPRAAPTTPSAPSVAASAATSGTSPGTPPPEALRPLAPGQPAPGSDDDIPWDDKPGRRLIAGGVVALVLSVAAFGISIATWRASQNAEPEAHDALSAVAAADPAYASANAAFFAQPTCAIVPTTGPAQNAVENYRAKCESGDSYASATRALIITGAVLGAVGVGGVVWGARKAAAGDGSRPSAVRLGAGPGGLTLSF